jgi:tRNA(Arg) A34 adenosine deaminase TadA
MTDATATDVAWMREALALAAEADLPFGAIIVKDGAVLARGRNSGKRRGDPTAHGEMVAIDECVAVHGAEALQARRSTPRANRARCAWARSYGAASGASSTPRRSRS